MNTEFLELRTPEKNLLVGMLENQNNKWFLSIKSRGKSDKIDLHILISILEKISKA